MKVIHEPFEKRGLFTKGKYSGVITMVDGHITSKAPENDVIAKPVAQKADSAPKTPIDIAAFQEFKNKIQMTRHWINQLPSDAEELHSRYSLEQKYQKLDIQDTVGQHQSVCIDEHNQISNVVEDQMNASVQDNESPQLGTHSIESRKSTKSSSPSINIYTLPQFDHNQSSSDNQNIQLGDNPNLYQDDRSNCSSIFKYWPNRELTFTDCDTAEPRQHLNSPVRRNAPSIWFPHLLH